MNRRPIAARKLAVVQALADGLARARVPANAISLFGLACGVGSGVALAATAGTGSWALWLGGGALVQLRLLANMLDGMVAERSAARSHRGELYNELPDRLSDAATLVGLGYAAGGDPILGFLAALAALLTAYVRAIGAAATGRQFFEGPMAKQQRMAVVSALALAGALAPGWIARPLFAGLGLPALGLGLIALLAAMTAWRRLQRIAAALDLRPGRG